jgi:hypothetical protein
MDVIVCDVAEVVDRDAVAVDALARLQLAARRSGRRILLRHARDDLKEVLAFSGLDDVLPCGESTSAVEPRRQTEEREDSRCVQKERDTGDPIA